LVSTAHTGCCLLVLEVDELLKSEDYDIRAVAALKKVFEESIILL
jgi:hypothetical protein